MTCFLWGTDWTFNINYFWALNYYSLIQHCFVTNVDCALLPPYKQFNTHHNLLLSSLSACLEVKNCWSNMRRPYFDSLFDLTHIIFFFTLDDDSVTCIHWGAFCASKSMVTNMSDPHVSRTLQLFCKRTSCNVKCFWCFKSLMLNYKIPVTDEGWILLFYCSEFSTRTNYMTQEFLSR